MRIAFLTADNRGVWRQYEKETPMFGPAPDALLSGFVNVPGLEVHVISCIRQPVKSPAKLADNIWFHSLTVPQNGWMRTGYFGCIRAVRRKLREIKPDLVHGQGTELESGICAALSGYPNVITLLGVMKEMADLFKSKPGSFYWCASLLESLALRRTIGVLANSRFTEACASLRTPRTWLVPNALRKEFLETPMPRLAEDVTLQLAHPLTPAFSPSDGAREEKADGEAPNQPTARRVVMNIGTITDYKRQNELLDMAETMRAGGVDLRMMFVGAATAGVPYADRFLQRIQGKDWVTWHRALSTEQIISQLDHAAALVHVSEIESFGLVVAEALARNVKFFGFGVAGVNDIAEGVAGAELFADGDWQHLQSAMRRWLDAGCPRPTTAAAAMRERYHPSVIATKHLDIYRQVLQNLRPH